MQKLHKYRHTVYGIYLLAKEGLDKDLARFGLTCDYRTFAKVVKEYFRNIRERLVLRNQEISLFNRFGSFQIYKELYKKADAHDAYKNNDGYRFFMYWRKPKIYAHKGVAFVPTNTYKSFITKNYQNGGDYPEFNADYVRSQRHI